MSLKDLLEAGIVVYFSDVQWVVYSKVLVPAC